MKGASFVHRVPATVRAGTIARLWLASIGGATLCSCAATEVKTTHYIGVFDTQQQVTQELYKITITGHSPWYHDVKYASGWVPAAQADLLLQDVRATDRGSVHVQGASPPLKSDVQRERPFLELGPLGVSFEPDSARFVIVMNSNPDFFFKKVAVLTRFANDRDQGAQRQTELLALLKNVQTERDDAHLALATRTKDANALASTIKDAKKAPEGTGETAK